MYTSTFIALLLATSANLVSAHGTVSKIKVGSKTYPGSVGQGADPSNSPVRVVASGDPIDDVTSSDMTCGRSAKAAPVSLSANSGDTLQIYWQAEGGGNWFHNVGPVIGYMTKCPGDCKDFNPDSSTQWFKVSALGLVDGSDKWYQAKMNDGSPLPVTIPSGLPGGNYMLRHEILALQNAASPHLAEFYPNCIQMNINGGPTANTETITPTGAFPGAYKFDDKGILVDVYTPPLNYVMPGPAVANIAQGTSGDDSGSSPAPAPSGSKAPTNAAPAPTGSSAPAPSSSASGNATNGSGNGKCKLKSKSSNGKTKRNQKRALKAHAKRRIVEASY